MDETKLRWRYFRTSFLALFGSIWALVGTVLFLVGAVPLAVSAISSPKAAPLEGRVIEKGEDADAEGRVRRWIRFVWRDPSGAERSSLVEASGETWSRTSPNDVVELEILAAQGASPSLVARRASLGELWIFVAAGAVCGAVGWTLVIVAARKAGARARLLSSGKLAQATVTALEEQTHVRINRRHPLVLAFEFKDDAGQRRSGRSQFLPRALEQRWQPGSPIRVAYDPLDPERNEADIFDARGV